MMLYWYGGEIRNDLRFRNSAYPGYGGVGTRIESLSMVCRGEDGIKVYAGTIVV